MSRTPKAAPAALALLLTAAAVHARAAPSAAHGQALFMRDGCYECHGTVGQGAVTGPRLTPPAPDAQTISAYIRAPAGQMPPYSPKVITEAEIADIAAYLASVKGPAKAR